MRTAKKTSKAKTKTKPNAKTAKAVGKAKPSAAAKATATARSKKVAPKRSAAKAMPKRSAPKAAPATKTGAKSGSEATTVRLVAVPAPKRAPRRDGTGRLDPKYARDLRALSLQNRDENKDRAFFTSPRSGDDLAEELGEEAVETMTSGEDQSERLIGEEVEEERGGPFVKTRGDDEFAAGTDRSNPSDATREPFPRT